VKDQDEPIDARLERLARATADVKPRVDFGARVMGALENEKRESGGVLIELGRPARRILPALAVAAAVSLFWAVESNDAFDDAVSLYADESVEVEW
jgi:hypothetical protein